MCAHHRGKIRDKNFLHLKAFLNELFEPLSFLKVIRVHHTNLHRDPVANPVCHAINQFFHTFILTTEDAYRCNQPILTNR